MSELLLVGNPKRRRTRKHRTAAQRAATRRLIAFNKARHGTSHNPRRLRRTYRHVARSTHSYAANPRRRRHAVAVHHRRHRRHVRRNPAGVSMRGIPQLLTRSATGAVGALGVDALYGFLSQYLPANFSSSMDAAGGLNFSYYFGKGATAVLLGMVGRPVLGRWTVPVVEGSLTVTLHDAGRHFLQQAMPSVPLGGMGWLSPARVVPPLPISQNLSGMGRYLTGGATRRLGMYTSPAARESMVR